MTDPSTDEKPVFHDPVMVEEVLSYLEPQKKKSGVFVDATTSTGGHAKEVVKHLGSAGTFIGLDLDRFALEAASDRLNGFAPEVKLYQANYKNVDLVLEKTRIEAVDGILFDLGFSSFQLEDSERGFSFQEEGPLDMRMNPEEGITAEEIVNQYSFAELKNIFLRYGEEGWADGVAKEIVKVREKNKITSTGQLVDIIREAIPKGERKRRKTHPATKTFQALRIAVNKELSNLEEGLKTGFNCLKKDGVIVVISYHSLEDRRVKRFFNFKEKDCICPPDFPVCRCDKEKEIQILVKGVTPGESEIRENPRARSARLRAGKRVKT
ncbi:16S rRNA (cytosine(1402)-N(4))-methyltransferase RsmH [Candidatus Bipolaricaulota bacterium]|nr:16S rRNA (cytosine(1402)-N(4))-methyltransferase RsmH [Candidatus Bipolaricaulota bacterium]MBS3814398.1 16S rRNA (cytosine(1402)-N(4))-methyltransferase RsmH [Candidatus Bipolaricaulota bacterium]MBS3825503.1 16S rRNA (cytosine(1402)-N(4))-methyltransferase RsmH [Candidatus Bipolaricaulota bacterium]